MAFLKIYNIDEYKDELKVNVSEVKRYAGIMSRKESEFLSPEAEKLMHECIEEALPVFSYKVSYEAFSLDWKEDKPVLPFDAGDSKDLSKNLSGSDSVILFAATVGIGIDRLIAKYNRVSPAKALFMQALGAERIETLCDLFNDWVKEEQKKENRDTAPRYSPGYGDLPLTVQKDFMSLLDCSRRLGITLNESLLMTPSKSVTAIIGIHPAGVTCKEKESGCASCSNENCEFRK